MENAVRFHCHSLFIMFVGHQYNRKGKEQRQCQGKERKEKSYGNGCFIGGFFVAA